jgi:nitroreductase
MSDGQPGFTALEFEPLSPEVMARNARQFHARMRQRRTVRDYSDRPVPRTLIEQAIATAGTAPSGANMQPWHFVAVSNPSVKRRIRIAAEAEERAFYQQRASAEWLAALAPLGTDEHKPFLEIAPWLIAVFLQKFGLDSAGRRQKHYYTAESVGIATGLLITSLHLSGLATLTHTPSPMKFLNGILGRPKHERPYLLLVAGYPADGALVPVIEKHPVHEIATFVE